MSKQHYALVEKEGCRPLKITAPKQTENKASTKNAHVRSELGQIYQTYADLYPNPRLIEEKRQRDTLLQAARAASSFQHQELDKAAAKKPRRGFFTFLFGTREDPQDTKKISSKDNNNNDDDENDARIKYVEVPNEHDDGSLCGTLQSLDISCIPTEVYTVARSHLTSTRTRRDHPNALRWGPQSRHLTQQQQQHASESSSSVLFLVVGLGEIAEFGGSNLDSSSSSSSRLLHTSDREELLSYAEGSQEFDLSAVRGTVLSQNCIAVSWGFLDGITVFYRRRVLLDEDQTLQEEGWQAFWWLGPSGPVLQNLTNDDLFHDDAEQPGSPLLKISDCVALHVEAPVLQQESDTKPLVATLVVSRLGGYIELVPLPTDLWNGPILQRDFASTKKEEHQQRRRQRKQHWHYATGKNIGCPPSSLALTTFDYHLDVQALEVHRTKVNSETLWDNEKYPNGPPGEFLLVASGLSVNGGHGETLTFWGVSTLFSPPEETSRPGDIDFQLHSSLLEAIWSSTGAPVSVFATPGIMKRWRTPRQVELKDDGCGDASNDGGEDSNPPAKPLAPVTTLSTTAPIVSMKFSNADGSSGPYLSVLDWNGVVQIFDCSILSRLASQDLTDYEYDRYRNLHAQSEQEVQPEEPFNLVESVVLRSQVTAALQKVTKNPTVGNFHWLESTGLEASGKLPSIVFLLSRCKKLAVVTFDCSRENGEQHRPYERNSLQSSVISVPFPSLGAAIETFADNSLSFASMKTGTSKSSPQNTLTHVLKYFVMEQLQPVAIVKTLARESKLKEAIRSASKLSKYEQKELSEVVVDCHRRLWETKRDVQSLSATNDNSYIVREALSICSSDKKEDGIEFENLRSVLKLALEISSAGNEEARERVRKNFVRLGTYDLLCRYYGTKPSMTKFRAEFLALDLVTLSFQLAGRGDITALSILLFRHRSEVRGDLLSILGTLPLALNSNSFCHLLPVIRKAAVSDLFLDAASEHLSELPWSHMPQFVIERHQVSIVDDRFDERIVLEYNKRGTDKADSTDMSEVLVSDWFVKRAKQMQAFVGHVDDVIRFSEFGIQCVGEKTTETACSSVVELHAMCRTALSLQRMLLDEAVSIDGDGIDTDDLKGMNLVDLLELVLDSGAQSSEVRYRFQEYVQPLVMEMSLSKTSADLDNALVEYCLRESQKCNDLHIVGAKHALAAAVAIAENSKASLNEKTRLITKEESLVRMVLAVAIEVSKNLDASEVPIKEKRDLIESIWSLYETLPTTPEIESEVKLQAFYQDLVGADILSRWPGCQPFVFFNKRQVEREKEETDTIGEEHADILRICNSFLITLDRLTTKQEEIALLHDLLSDVRGFNEVVSQNSADISRILCNRLIPAFLEKANFGLVASYLGAEDSVVDKKQVILSVIEYLDEAMFSAGEDDSVIMNAIRCQDILEPILPEIQSVCQSNRRYLDAAHFVTTVLFDGKLAVPLKPSDFKDMSALDAIETVLREVPECIICRCTQWADSDYSRDANKTLRQADPSTWIMIDEHQTNELPELPGGAVFHLATILGLQSKVSAVVVKSRVIHYALHCGFHGAGAAIARTLSQDQDFGSGDNADIDFIKLDAIACVVSNEAYLDQITKKELCETVLRRLKSEVSIRNSESFNTILRVSSGLDQLTSRFEQEMNDMPPMRKESLFSRPIVRLHMHTFHEYNRDVHALFKDLSSQANQGLVHDSLMDALSRFIFYWCIHDSKTLKSAIDLRCKADTRENLILGCALVLQIPSNNTAANSVHELQEIAVAQAASVATEERFESVNVMIIPNPDILKHLIDRGFSDNAARRAVTMTGNAGYREALGWAVQHTMDSDFNEPLVLLRSSNRRFIDEGSIQSLHKSLIQLSSILKNPTFRSEFLCNIGCGLQHKIQSNPVLNSSRTVTKLRPINNKMKKLQKKKSLPTHQKEEQKVAKQNGQSISSQNHSLEQNGTKPMNVEETLQKKPPPPPPRDPKVTANGPVSKPTKPVVKESSTLKNPVAKHGSAVIGNGIKSVDPVGAAKALSKFTSEQKGKSPKPVSSMEGKPKENIEKTPLTNGNQSLPPAGKPKIVSKATTERREEMLRRLSIIQAKEKTKDDGTPIANGTNALPTAGATMTLPKATSERREDILKRAAATRAKQKTKLLESASVTNGTHNVPSTAPTSSPKNETERREELRKRGKEALDRMRSARNGAPKIVNNSESRQRLIEEARQKYRQAKPAAPNGVSVSQSHSNTNTVPSVPHSSSSQPTTTHQVPTRSVAPRKPSAPPPAPSKVESQNPALSIAKKDTKAIPSKIPTISHANGGNASKVTKVATDVNDGDDTGWDFDDFDDF